MHYEDNFNINLFDEFPTMSVELECTSQACTAGLGEMRWKTQALSENNAMRMLRLHEKNYHPVIVQAAPAGGDGGTKSRLVKLYRPKFTENCTQQDF